MIRILQTLAAMLLATLPLRADPLPQGEFMLGTYLWPDFAYPFRATLSVGDTGVTLGLSRYVPLNFLECNTTGTCLYAITTATARAEVTDGIVILTNIDVSPPFTPEVWDDPDPHVIYTSRLLAALQYATLTPTDTGFTLASAQGPTTFVYTTPQAQAAINAFACTQGISMQSLLGCDVRQLAAMFIRTDLNVGEQVFRDALRGMADVWDLIAQRAALDPMLSEPHPEDEAELDALDAVIAIRIIFRAMPDVADPLEAAWDGPGRDIFRDDRAAFDAAIASYDGTLLPLVAFMRHTSDMPSLSTNPRPCDDLSFGFIAAQGG